MAEKVLSWAFRKPLYQSHYDNLWKNTSTDKLLIQHGAYKHKFGPDGALSGLRSVPLTESISQKVGAGSVEIGQKNTTHSAFHSAKALEKELTNRKIDFKPIELRIPVKENVSKFKTKTNVIKTLLSNVKKLGPALKNIKGLSVLGPLTGLGYAADVLGPTNIMGFKDAKITPSEETTPQTERFREGGLVSINYLTRRL